MKKFSSITKRFVSVLCALTLLVSGLNLFAVTASAASVTQKYNCDRTVTFTVKTGSKDSSIKFTSEVAPKVQRHRCSKAPVMAISVSPSINGKDFFLVKGTGKTISSVLKFEKNRTYTVKISYYVNKTNKCSCRFGDLTYVNLHDLSLSTRYRGYNGRDCYVNGNWYFSRVTNCKISNIRVK